MCDWVGAVLRVDSVLAKIKRLNFGVSRFIHELIRLAKSALATGSHRAVFLFAYIRQLMSSEEWQETRSLARISKQGQA
jgi:hypothetical protein